MFKIIKRDSVEWPVRVSVPMDGGAVHQQVFQARLKLLPQSEVRRLMASANAAEDTSDLARNVLLDWRDVTGEDGEPLAFSDEARDRLIDIPYVRIALMAAFVEANNGQAANLKN